MEFNLFKKFRKSLTIKYINKFLRAKGIATSEVSETTIRFKLYDMNFDLSSEKERLIIRATFNLGDDINMVCMFKALNQVNYERWIVKAFVETYTPDDNDKDTKVESAIIFSFETFCFREYDFAKIYEFAIYALNDCIDFHKKCYSQYLNELSQKGTDKVTKIGFSHSSSNEPTSSVPMDAKPARKIGFIQ